MFTYTVAKYMRERMEGGEEWIWDGKLKEIRVKYGRRNERK
jgi:hypothetical protein